MGFLASLSILFLCYGQMYSYTRYLTTFDQAQLLEYNNNMHSNSPSYVLPM
ncbi:hypothetical protein DICVIV_09281 [Dictyocaulus viviparus]|uniref:Uncharacterized protein n=1 Tax=Dictyocaulus viviparus TaxID=29172 RepID=A0A0D8XLM8_DICVI|nr:hypothetical protein DICVIV_09281 [Dictyocaulus viviparus]